LLVNPITQPITYQPRTSTKDAPIPYCAKSPSITGKNHFELPSRYYTPIFTSRSEDHFSPVSEGLHKEMMFAEAVMNNMKNKCPSFSPSKALMVYNLKKASPKFIEKIEAKEGRLNYLRNRNPDDNIPKYVKTVIENYRLNDNSNNNHLANCSELSELTQTALVLNGVKNIKAIDLVGYTDPEFKSSYGIDHVFLLVNGKSEFDGNWDKPVEKYGKNAYVVDPWLGFVDSAENAMKIYKKIWENIPHYQGITGYGMKETSTLDFTHSDIKEIKNRYPGLILNENVNLKRYEK